MATAWAEVGGDHDLINPHHSNQKLCEKFADELNHYPERFDGRKIETGLKVMGFL